MTRQQFKNRLAELQREHKRLITRRNKRSPRGNEVFSRYLYPVLTAGYTPLFWRYDFNYDSSPNLMERMGVNSTSNPGAIELNGKIHLAVRVEGIDRKSFFAIAESANGIDNFRFWDYPIQMPGTDNPDVNVYDMRLVKHEDGWIYALFCTERKDPAAPRTDTSSAIAQCGVARTKDLKTWERFDDIKTHSPQ